MNTEKSTGFLSWVKTHPQKAMILLFLIVIPLLFVILFSVSFTNKGKSFYFDVVSEEPQLIYQNKISKQSTLDIYFEDFEINLLSVRGTTNNEGEEITYGIFEFEKTQKMTNHYVNSTVTFRYVMTANWFSEQSTIVSSNSTKFTVTFPYNLPKHKHLILKVNKPILYVEINIVRPTLVGDDIVLGHEEVTLYYKYDLNNVKYTNVLP